MERILLILAAFACARAVQANSCCGQSPSSYAVLYQRQKASVALNASLIQTEGRVFSNQDFFVWPEQKRRTVQSYQMQSAATLSEWWQVFGSVGWLSSVYSEGLGTERAQHLSDTQLGLSYELVPEYTYSPWKPVVYASVFLNVPTGQSIYSPGGLTEGADVTGHDQWGLGLGLTLRKVISPVIFVMQAKALRLREETFSQITVSGFYDLSLATTMTYATDWWGVSVTGGWTWNQLTSRALSVSPIASGDSEVHTLNFSLQKNLNDQTAVMIAISDQTLWGRAQNTLLNRTYSINLNYQFF